MVIEYTIFEMATRDFVQPADGPFLAIINNELTDEARGMMTYNGEAGPVQTYLARPSVEGPRPAVIVIHEIVGLTDHIKSVADRFAEEG